MRSSVCFRGKKNTLILIVFVVAVVVSARLWMHIEFFTQQQRVEKKREAEAEGESRTLITTCMHAHTPVAAHTHIHRDTFTSCPCKGVQPAAASQFGVLTALWLRNVKPPCWMLLFLFFLFCLLLVLLCFFFFAVQPSQRFSTLVSWTGWMHFAALPAWQPPTCGGGPACRPQPSRLYLLSFN